MDIEVKKVVLEDGTEVATIVEKPQLKKETKKQEPEILNS